MFWYQNWIFVKNLHFFEYQLDAIQFDLRYLTTLFFPSYYNTIYLSIYRSLFLILSTYFFPSTCDFPPTSANLAWGKKENQFKNPNKEIKTWKKTLENCLFHLIQLKTSSFASASKINVNKHLFAWNEIQMNKSCTSSTN